MRSPHGDDGALSAASPLPQLLNIRRLGLVEYLPTYKAMREANAARVPGGADELWLLEHAPVYTLGQAGRREHLLRDNGIPLVPTDRGGQITYHGPGQLVIYTLLDLRARDLGVRAAVQLLEQAVIDFLAAHGIAAARRKGAPGVYVAEAKIAALGLRVRNGCCYHGLALNVDLDLAPFEDIDPCGYRGLNVTRLADLGVRMDTATAGEALAIHIQRLLEHATAPASA
jgi:lipoyl(octanoyl) transferase